MRFFDRLVLDARVVRLEADPVEALLEVRVEDLLEERAAVLLDARAVLRVVDPVPALLDVERRAEALDDFFRAAVVRPTAPRAVLAVGRRAFFELAVVRFRDPVVVGIVSLLQMLFWTAGDLASLSRNHAGPERPAESSLFPLFSVEQPEKLKLFRFLTLFVSLDAWSVRLLPTRHGGVFQMVGNLSAPRCAAGC